MGVTKTSMGILLEFCRGICRECELPQPAASLQGTARVKISDEPDILDPSRALIPTIPELQHQVSCMTLTERMLLLERLWAGCHLDDLLDAAFTAPKSLQSCSGLYKNPKSRTPLCDDEPGTQRVEGRADSHRSASNRLLREGFGAESCRFCQLRC